jgi:hypothetical protein
MVLAFDGYFILNSLNFGSIMPQFIYYYKFMQSSPFEKGQDSGNWVNIDEMDLLIFDSVNIINKLNTLGVGIKGVSADIEGVNVDKVFYVGLGNSPTVDTVSELVNACTDVTNKRSHLILDCRVIDNFVSIRNLLNNPDLISLLSQCQGCSIVLNEKDNIHAMQIRYFVQMARRSINCFVNIGDVLGFLTGRNLFPE